MGIVCQCPNGHRVKVKDQFAGKRGLCPRCGTTFSIPATGGELQEPGDTPAAPQFPLARFVPLDQEVIATLPRALAWGTVHAAAVPAASQNSPADEPLESESPDTAKYDEVVTDVGEDQFVPAPDDAAAAPLHPAIADRPDLSWRIAYPGGEASEPVDAIVMQQWLAAGQAEGSELVWRADWGGWLPVRGVFPEFFPGI